MMEKREDKEKIEGLRKGFPLNERAYFERWKDWKEETRRDDFRELGCLSPEEKLLISFQLSALCRMICRANDPAEFNL